MRNLDLVLPLLLPLLALPACQDQPPAPPPGKVQSTAAEAPRANDDGKLELVARFDGAMPTGVTVSRHGRVFVNFPRWGDRVDFTVGELLKDGKVVPYPNAEVNAVPQGALDKGFVSVQSVVVDPSDRLWVLDTGSIEMKPSELGGPKLVRIDLTTNQIDKTIVFPRNVALATSYPNDVRFDLRRGKGGMAFVTDSSANGPNGILVVDLDSGRSWRKLHDHPSTKAEKGFLPIVDGHPISPMAMGSDGIAISNDGRTLYYCPLSSRRLYSVSTDALADEKLSDREVAKTVQDLGEKGASDGLESDAQGRLYATEYESNAILRRNPNGSFETIAVDARAMWPDTMSLADDGYLYFTANQLQQQARYHGGKDLRQKPYVLFRVKTDGTPVRLSRD